MNKVQITSNELYAELLSVSKLNGQNVNEFVSVILGEYVDNYYLYGKQQAEEEILRESLENNYAEYLKSKSSVDIILAFQREFKTETIEETTDRALFEYQKYLSHKTLPELKKLVEANEIRSLKTI